MPAYKGPHILGIYSTIDELIDGIRELKRAKKKRFTVISPVPHHDIEYELHPKPSPVRVFTLFGGLFGFALGWSLTYYATESYPLIVGGKPYFSIPPYGIIAYILTILFGALATILGVFLNTRLPEFVIRDAYDERLSSDHFGIQYYGSEDELDTVERIFKNTGTVDVHRMVFDILVKREFID
jgi:hypothetical protein